MHGTDVRTDPRRELARRANSKVRTYRYKQEDTCSYDGTDDFGIFKISRAVQSEREGDVYAMARQGWQVHVSMEQ